VGERRRGVRWGAARPQQRRYLPTRAANSCPARAPCRCCRGPAHHPTAPSHTFPARAAPQSWAATTHQRCVGVACAAPSSKKAATRQAIPDALIASVQARKFSNSCAPAGWGGRGARVVGGGADPELPSVWPAAPGDCGRSRPGHEICPLFMLHARVEEAAASRVWTGPLPPWRCQPAFAGAAPHGRRSPHRRARTHLADSSEFTGSARPRPAERAVWGDRLCACSRSRVWTARTGLQSGQTIDANNVDGSIRGGGFARKGGSLAPFQADSQAHRYRRAAAPGNRRRLTKPFLRAGTDPSHGSCQRAGDPAGAAVLGLAGAAATPRFRRSTSDGEVLQAHQRAVAPALAGPCRGQPPPVPVKPGQTVAGSGTQMSYWLGEPPICVREQGTKVHTPTRGA
jgi:hypothetical protein